MKVVRSSRPLFRGITSTTVTAAAVAALTAAQPPVPIAKKDKTTTTPPSGELTATGGTPFYTLQAPPLTVGSSARPKTNTAAPKGYGIADIPAGVFAAYRRATSRIAKTDPGCHLPWQLLAAIGKVESSHARGGRVDSHGNASPSIYGPQLNGNGFAAIRDTDNGAYDGDISYDRAVGPMQFIPSTWTRWRTDGNNDGTAHPNNVYDSTLAAGHYLCAGGRDLANPQSMSQAILSYNYSAQYLATVTSWFMYYTHGYRVVPNGVGPVPPPPDSGASPATVPAAPLSPAQLAAAKPGGSSRPRPGVPAPAPIVATTPPPAPDTSAPPTPSEPPPADPPASDPPTSDPTPSPEPSPVDSSSPAPSDSEPATSAAPSAD